MARGDIGSMLMGIREELAEMELSDKTLDLSH